MWILIRTKSQNEEWSFAVPLPAGELIVGRGKECTIALNNPHASRRHLRICSDGKAVSACDLKSEAGTLLNGKEFNEGAISLGDQLEIAGTELHLVAKLPRTTAKVAKRQKAERGSSLDWSTFHAFIAELVDKADPQAVLKSLLAGLVEQIGAERGFALTYGGSGRRFKTIAAHALDKEGELVELSSSVYKEALQTKKVIVVPSTAMSKTFSDARSLVLFEEPRAIVCAPLFVEDKPYGVLYLDRRLSAGALDVQTLQVIESVSSLASQLIANAQLHKELDSKVGRLGALERLTLNENRFVMGQGGKSEELKKHIDAVAPQDITVLITGPTGTGKEVVARQVHRQSARQEGPFIAVNCAALSRDVIEAELFGAEKGAFTGCDKRRVGYFEAAHGGTLFLDEVAEIPKELQVKLLRVLQERTITRVGGTSTIPVDFRLICATNVLLEEAIKDGDFREDLYYRLNVFRLQLLPLHKRKEDILPIAEHFLKSISYTMGKAAKSFSKDAQKKLLEHAWPGNVRELRNAVERAVVIESGSQISAKNLPIAQMSQPTVSPINDDFWDSLPQDFDSACSFFQEKLLHRTLEAHKGNASAASRSLGIARSTLYRYLGKFEEK